MKARRLAVLISGAGTNLQALINACSSGRLDMDITHVISDRAAAPGLQRAARAGIPCSLIEQARFAQRIDFDRALSLLLAYGQPDLVILAGFMRIVGSPVLEAFGDRMINLHPSLLPLHPGTDTYRRALAAGDREHGASIHFVSAELDAGPLISQVHIPVLPGDDPATLAARLAPREHELLVATTGLFGRHSVQHRDGTVLIDGAPLRHPLRLDDHGHFSG